MTLTISITEKAILRLLGQFIDDNVPALAVVGQVNRVAEPIVNDFIIMWPIERARLSTNIDTQSDDGLQKTMLQKTSLGIQLDIHGPNSTDNAQIFTTLWRDAAACTALAETGIQPLFCDDGHQVPFVNGEGQYEDRWVIIAHLQADPTITITQQSATALDIGLISVDAEYAP